MKTFTIHLTDRNRRGTNIYPLREKINVYPFNKTTIIYPFLRKIFVNYLLFRFDHVRLKHSSLQVGVKDDPEPDLHGEHHHHRHHPHHHCHRHPFHHHHLQVVSKIIQSRICTVSQFTSDIDLHRHRHHHYQCHHDDNVCSRLRTVSVWRTTWASCVASSPILIGRYCCYRHHSHRYHCHCHLS